MSQTDDVLSDRRLATRSPLTPAVSAGQAGRSARRRAGIDADVSSASQARLDEVRCEQVFECLPRDHDRALDERAAVLALGEAAREESHRAAVVIEATGSALGLLEGDRTTLDPWEVEFADVLTRAVGPADIERAGALIAESTRQGVDVVTVLDAEYPVNLRMVHNPPPALFVRGALPATRRVVAIVGTRRSNTEGGRRASELATALAAHGVVVASDLARGIGTIAHGAALEAGGLTVAVMGAGIDVLYPLENQEVAGEIAERGALVSPAPAGTPPSHHTLRLRRAVLSGLAAAVVVVEGGVGRALASTCFEQGRPVLFVEGLSADEDWARAWLGKGLGTVIGSADDVLSHVRCLTEVAERGIVT
jgi:DNA processing protein